MLKTDVGYLHEVVSKFNVSQGIFLPSFSQSQLSPGEEKCFHPKCQEMFLKYLEVSEDFRRSSALFVLLSGYNRGISACKAYIGR